MTQALVNSSDTGFGKEPEYAIAEPRQIVHGDLKSDDMVR